MLIDVKIWLYDLSRCGYFPFRGNTPLFGGIPQSFDALTAWTSGKLLGATSTFTPADGEESGGAYFLDIHRGANGDFLVGLWNRLPGNKNNISSVGVGDVVGAASAEITEIDRNRIPGFATYFWVIPSAQRVACVRVKHDSHGLENFKKYMTAFLKVVNPQNVVLGPPSPNGDIEIAGYRRDTTTSDVVNGAYPRFSVKSIALGGDVAYLLSNAGAIDRILSRTTLSSEHPGDFTRWQQMLSLSRVFRTPPPLREEALVKLEFPIQLTRAQLAETITAWQQRDDNNDATAQDDLGFHLRNGEVKWLSKSQPRTGYQIDVAWIDDELVDMASLFTQLQVHRTAVVALG